MIKSTSGFTIVELLVTIVVIAILASITTVAYSGIQNRAMLARDQSDLNTVVEAINLYAASGGSMRDGVAGAGNNGYWYGSSKNIYPGSVKSMEDALKDAGYLSPSFDKKFMLALCNGTGANTDERAVMIKSDATPEETPTEQIAPRTCTHSSFSLYTDPDSQYKNNMAKMVF